MTRCEYCHGPIDPIWIGTGTGKAHPHCYYEAHPPRLAENIYDVITGSEPVLARDVLHEFLSSDRYLSDRIINEYNRRVKQDHARRIKP